MSSQYDRQELYQKVWERPLIKVAEEFGVSADALGKACRKLSVPMPGRGYWAKVAHGHSVIRKPLLPKLDKAPVVHRSSRPDDPKIAMVPDAEFAAIDQMLTSGALNPLPALNTTTPHVLIRRTRSRLRRRSRKNERGILLASEPGGLDVRVTATALDRSLEVVSSVLAVLERQGFSVEISEEGATSALVNGRRVLFGIEEAIRTVVTQKPRVPHPENSWDYDRTVRYEATGVLSLNIHSDLWLHQLRRKWTDGKRQRVEDLIPQFVAGLMRVAVVLRRQTEEQKKREEERQQREREMFKLRAQIEAEEKKLTQFNQWIDNWEKAERLRRFIAVYAEKTSKWAAERQPHYREWIEWANRQADRLDPFISDKPPSVLDRKHELGRW